MAVVATGFILPSDQAADRRRSGKGSFKSSTSFSISLSRGDTELLSKPSARSSGFQKGSGAILVPRPLKNIPPPCSGAPRRTFRHGTYSLSRSRRDFKSLVFDAGTVWIGGLLSDGLGLPEAGGAFNGSPSAAS